jgi:exodeoxyribonuclease VII small subunit
VADAAAQPVSEKYEDIVARLARVVERLEGGGLSLEESISAFEEGIQLARAGAARLEEAERKVEVLLEGDRAVPFSGQEKWIAAEAARRRLNGSPQEDHHRR